MKTVRKFSTFLTDADGVNQKDYLLLLTSIFFFGPIAFGFLQVIQGKDLSESYLKLLDMITPVMLAVVAGVFTLTGVEKLMTTKNKPNTAQTPTEDIYKVNYYNRSQI